MNQLAPKSTAAAARGRSAARWAMLFIIFTAFGLRAYHLDYQSLWSDEGISVLRAAQPLGQLWRTMPIEHVPGYFALLHAWMQLTGEADYALRYLSLLPGVFAVALMMRTGRDLGSRRIGLIAGALLATSAFQIWYSQELRMYSWLLAAGLFSTWCLWLMWTRPPSAAVWLGYVLSTTAAIYLHYFGFLVPIVHCVVALVWLATKRDVAAFLRWASAGTAVFVLFLPWALRALALFGFSGWRAPIDPNQIPWLLLRTYTAGETMPEPWARWTALLHLTLICLGAAAWTRRDKTAGLFLTAVAASAIAITWLLVIRQPDFHVRYTIFVSAPLTLLVAGGVAGLDPLWWRRSSTDQHARGVSHTLQQSLPWLALALLVALNGLALHRLYTDESVHKPDFRSASAHIERHLQPGDIVLIDGPNPELVFEHYYDGAAPVHDLRRLENLPDAEVDEALSAITAGAGRAWELLYFKPPGPVQVWLATRGWASPPTDHNGIRVQLVGLPSGPVERLAQGVYFGDALELVASEYDPRTHAPGDLVRISTDWQTHARAPEYKFSLRLVDESDTVVNEVDYVPQNWFAPTHVWFVGEPARDQHGLLLPDDLAPGSYRVTLRLYDPYTGAPVETAAGVDVPIAAFSVENGHAHGQ